MRNNWQPDTSHFRNGTGPSGCRIQDGSRADLSSVGEHSGGSAVLDGNTRDLRVRVNLDTHAITSPSIPPDHRVVADNAARRMVQGRQNRIARVAAQIHGRHQFPDLRPINHAAVDAKKLIVLGTY